MKNSTHIVFFYKFGNFSKRFCEFFLRSKIIYKNIFKLEKITCSVKIFPAKSKCFSQNLSYWFPYPYWPIKKNRFRSKRKLIISVTIGIGRNGKKPFDRTLVGDLPKCRADTKITANAKMNKISSNF